MPKTQEFDFGELDELYREVIIDHYRNPRNRRQIEDADIRCEGSNPFCGDGVIIQLKLDDQGRVSDVAHQGQGCSVSQASASILTDMLKGKTPKEGEAISRSFHQMMLGSKLSDEAIKALGNLEAFQGVRKFPIRIKCALLAWDALESGLRKHHPKSKPG